MAKQKAFKFRKYTAPAYIIEAMESLRPPEELTVSQWAERERILDEKSSNMPGPWRNSVTPYLVGIMDAFSDWQTEKVVFCKPTQVGGTEILLNEIGYIVVQDPGPGMAVYPTDELGERTVDGRIKPMINASPKIRGRFMERSSSKKELQFTNMNLYIAGANSPSGLASSPIRYLFLDEVDKYPGATKKEADAISLAEERTKTFKNRKIYMCSTPTLRTGQIWKQMEGCDVEKHYFVPCPHCKKMQELRFKQIKWPAAEQEDGKMLTDAERADRAFYVCPECGAVINDADKTEMLRKGEWRAVRGNQSSARSVAFWMNTLYSPFTRFSEIAKAFLNCRGDTDALHNFTNSWLAEPWEDTRLKMTAELVKQRQTNLKEFTVPEWAKLITAGIDVQEKSMYYVIRAWGNYMTSQLITRGQIVDFRSIETIMNLEYMKESGEKMLVDLCLIDSGDQTDEVYDFCVENTGWCMPCKGTPTRNSHYSISTINKVGSSATGMSLVLVDGGKYKDMISGRMRRENGEGSWMVFEDIDNEYCEQVTAEHKIVEKGVEVWRQRVSHADNHYLDAEVYCAAAADIMGVRRLHLQEAETEAGKNETRPDKEQTPQAEGWLRQQEGWI